MCRKCPEVVSVSEQLTRDLVHQFDGQEAKSAERAQRMRVAGGRERAISTTRIPSRLPALHAGLHEPTLHSETVVLLFYTYEIRTLCILSFHLATLLFFRFTSHLPSFFVN